MSFLISKMHLKHALEGKLTGKEIGILRRSYDVIGSVAVLEVPEGLSRKEKLIASQIMMAHKNVKTVVKKSGAHEGRFRLQKTKHVAGIRTKETEHRENNIRIRLDIDKVYFSPRMATERLRITKQVKKGEKVLVLFSGCAPYPLVIARNSGAKSITGVELNSNAHKYAQENVRLNKASNIILIKGDAKKFVESTTERYDRVVMPLPKAAGKYLKGSLRVVKKGGFVHYYGFLSEDEMVPHVDFIKQECKRAGRKCAVLGIVKCGQLAPRMYRVCYDIRII